MTVILSDEYFADLEAAHQQNATLSAEVERLKKGILEELDYVAALEVRLDTTEARADTAEREAAKLREALRPFAANAEVWKLPDDHPVLWLGRGKDKDFGVITEGHFRRAAALVAAADAGRGEGRAAGRALSPDQGQE